MFGMLGKKHGMTQVFAESGDIMPVTVIEVGPCAVVQKKLKETDGYNALQLGFAPQKAKLMQKPRRGHLEKKGLPLYSKLREFRTEGAGEFSVGDMITAGVFRQGDRVDVSGVTKGRGFQGVIKRHGKHGGPASHGSDFHRRPGSIGMRTWPGRVPKNMKLPGHMGVENVTVKNLKVVEVRPESNCIFVKGAVPGFSGADVVVHTRDDSIWSRLKTVTRDS